MDSITIQKPDDWHVHFRDEAILKAVAPLTARAFGRAIVMPNLAPKPVTTRAQAHAYKKRIEEALADNSFTPLMTFYMTDTSSPEEISTGYLENHIAAVKLYPAGATTHSEHGVTDIKNVYGVLERMQEIGMPLLVHGETLLYENGDRVDPYDREKVFIDVTLVPLLKQFPKLRVVLEHATTKEAVDFVTNEKSDRLGPTITVQHLMINRTDMFEGGLQPHLYCLPPVKRSEHQQTLRKAATSGSPYFFLGTDSAPHPTHAKERASGCAAGVFTAPAALELYLQVFEEENAIEHFEAFASLNGPRFYGLEPNTETVTLKKEAWTLDSLIEVENGGKIHPLGYHENPEKRLTIDWKLQS